MTTTPPPAPLPSAPPRLSPGGRSAARVLLIIAAAVLVIGVVVALSATAWGVSSLRVIRDSVTLPNSLTSVTIDTGSVPTNVRITTDREATEPRVDMRMVNSVRAGSDPLLLTADGATARVTIDAEPSEILQWIRAGEITVVLPPELARRVSVTTQQETGMLFAQADVDHLTARTVDGAIVLSGSARRVEVDSQHGDVTTSEPISVRESFTATTTTGDVSVEFADPPPTVDARAQHGDVVISLPSPGPYFVDAMTGTRLGSTEVRVPQTRDRANAAATITSRTDTGDVVINELN